MTRFKWFAIFALIGCLFVGSAYFGFSAVRRHAGGARQSAFYFWKTQWAPTPEILEGLKKSQVGLLYVRFFDVQWDKVTDSARPVSPIEFAAPLPGGLEVVPVVYLTNSVFLNSRYDQVEELGNHVWEKVSQMASEQGVKVRQLQIDCDWSDLSRRNYFHFADLLRRRLRASGVQLSATIRLHQIKYAERTGVPPVDRGMLMFYNFGRIVADGERSSIFNAEDARKYHSFISSYSLPLDLSLPLFSWIVHSREGKVLELIEKIDISELEHASDQFERVADNRFVARRSLFFRGRYFVEGDLLLVEATDPRVTEQAADLAADGAGLWKTYSTIAFFDLNERNLSHYAENDLKRIIKKFQ